MCIIGVLGNIFVIVAIIRFKVFHTPSYFILISLSAADLLSLLAIPLELVMHLTTDGAAYAYGCYIIWYTSVLGAYMNVNTICVTSVDRFIAVKFPIVHRYALLF